MTSAASAKGAKVCQECEASPVPAGRQKFCSEPCRIRSSDKRKAKRAPCIRCGGDKGYGTRGGRYCETCREQMGPVWKEMERERARRRDAVVKSKRTPVNKKVREDGQIWCPRCGGYLPPGRFPKKTGKPASLCRDHAREYHHERRIRLTYGITLDQYHDLSEAQGDRCAICLVQPRTARLAVDHDHATGDVRGLLCKRCNRDLLGAAHDSLEVLRRAVAYLEHPPAREVLNQGVELDDS